MADNRVRRQSGFPTFISCQRQDANVLPERRQSHQGDKLCDVSTVPLVARWPVFLARGSDADGEPHSPLRSPFLLFLHTRHLQIQKKKLVFLPPCLIKQVWRLRTAISLTDTDTDRLYRSEWCSKPNPAKVSGLGLQFWWWICCRCINPLHLTEEGQKFVTFFFQVASPKNELRKTRIVHSRCGS